MKLLNRLSFFVKYLSNPPWDTGITPPEVEDFVAHHPPARALDLGCGTGTNAIYLAQHGWEAIGVDFIERAIRKARLKANRVGVKVEFILDDVTRLRGVRGPFELILDIGCLHSLPDGMKQVYARNIPHLLSEQGTFLLYAFTKDQGDSGRGLDRLDIASLEENLALVEKQEGEFRGLPSAWFLWQKPNKPVITQ